MKEGTVCLCVSIAGKKCQIMQRKCRMNQIESKAGVSLFWHMMREMRTKYCAMDKIVITPCVRQNKNKKNKYMVEKKGVSHMRPC